jgi:hypothetical protein
MRARCQDQHNSGQRRTKQKALGSARADDVFRRCLFVDKEQLAAITADFQRNHSVCHSENSYRRVAICQTTETCTTICHSEPREARRRISAKRRLVAPLRGAHAVPAALRRRCARRSDRREFLGSGVKNLLHTGLRPFASLTPCPPRCGGAPGGVTNGTERLPTSQVNTPSICSQSL